MDVHAGTEIGEPQILTSTPQGSPLYCSTLASPTGAFIAHVSDFVAPSSESEMPSFISNADVSRSTIFSEFPFSSNEGSGNVLSGLYNSESPPNCIDNPAAAVESARCRPHHRKRKSAESALTTVDAARNQVPVKMECADVNSLVREVKVEVGEAPTPCTPKPKGPTNKVKDLLSTPSKAILDDSIEILSITKKTDGPFAKVPLRNRKRKRVPSSVRAVKNCVIDDTVLTHKSSAAATCMDITVPARRSSDGTNSSPDEQDMMMQESYYHSNPNPKKPNSVSSGNVECEVNLGACAKPQQKQIMVPRMIREVCKLAELDLRVEKVEGEAAFGTPLLEFLCCFATMCISFTISYCLVCVLG